VKASILIPACNAAEFIGATLAICVRQRRTQTGESIVLIDQQKSQKAGDKMQSTVAASRITEKDGAVIKKHGSIRRTLLNTSMESEWFNGRQMRKSLRFSWKATLQFAFLS
tara:strand:+ start:970 stop:1302 length:333 start_codon:yes stop_codon:yes gene_type:complete